jgi:hypothetical protein
MICFAKPGLTEDLNIVQKEEFSISCYMCDKRPSIFMRDKPKLLVEGIAEGFKHFSSMAAA